MKVRTSSTEGRKGVAVVGKMGRNFWVCEVDEEGSAEGAWIWIEGGMDCVRCSFSSQLIRPDEGKSADETGCRAPSAAGTSEQSS